MDACVIGVTDQGLLQRVANASASARDHQVNRLVESMPEPFVNYRDHVARAISAIVVSHRPDHSHEGRLHNDTAYGLLGNGVVQYTKVVDGKRVRVPERLSVLEFAEPNARHRHGTLADGTPRPYKGYKGDSNYCIEIVRNKKDRWEGEVLSTFRAYQVVRARGIAELRSPLQSANGNPLVMRLMINDCVKLKVDGVQRLMRVVSINGAGRLSLAEHTEANVDKRNRDETGEFRYTYKQAGSLQAAHGRRVTVSEIGDVRDSGLKA